MKVCTQGLWHLGSVTTACLASVGHTVIGLDTDPTIINELNHGKAPIFEPGLDDLIQSGISNGKISFTTNLLAAADAEILWVTFDTPVDNDDQADVEYVLDQIKSVLPILADNTVILISSQIPVGTIRTLENFSNNTLAEKSLSFAYSPENLRLGKALDVFLNPDRIVVGVRTVAVKNILVKLLGSITEKIEWMSVESAEMTKHAINAFLATSVTFANEIASICELVGADAKEVERGLKTEERIGMKAYLSPGGPFAGGTLARDIEFLGAISRTKQLITPILSSVRISNNEHKNWTRRKLLEAFGELKGVTIAIWGLTYKPNTDTLRRSLSVELCDWLIDQGATIQVYDPTAKQLPSRWSTQVTRHTKALDAVINADALVIGTAWPQFCKEASELISIVNANFFVIDAYRHLQMAMQPLKLNYITVGTPLKVKDTSCKI